MSYSSYKRFIASVCSLISTSLIALSPCSASVNLKLDLDTMISDLSQYNTEKFDKTLEDLEDNFISSYGNILELDESWTKVDKRLKYLYYHIIGRELEDIPLFKYAVEELNIIMQHKLKFEGHLDTCGTAYMQKGHAFTVSYGTETYDPWDNLNIFAKIKDIHLNPKKYLPKFNRGELYLPLKYPEEKTPSAKASVLDQDISNRMLPMIDWSDDKKVIAAMINHIIHESGHLIHEFLMKRFDKNGLYATYWINEVGLKDLVDYPKANHDWSALRDNRYVNIVSFKITDFINFLILLHVMKENDLDIKINKQTFEIPALSYGIFNCGNIFKAELSKNNRLNYGIISARGADDSCEFMAELWVATVGCGVLKNSWGEVFRNYLQMLFGSNCLGNAGNNWYTGKN